MAEWARVTMAYVKWATLVGCMAVLASACASAATSDTPSAAGGVAHIHGTFVLHAGPAPLCASPPAGGCPDYSSPIAAAVITVTNAAGTTVLRTSTNAVGVFDAAVPPGTYHVEAPPQSEPGMYQTTVTVRAGQTVDVTLEVSEP
jgi:hypothetical protein